MRRTRRQPTWAEVIIHRVGYRKSPRVIQLVMAWAIVEEELGRRPSVDEYAEWWGENRATAFRDVALFREALGPVFASPSDFIEAVGTQLAERVPDQYRTALA